MYTQVKQFEMSYQRDSMTSVVNDAAEDHFLDTLLSWGPTKTLKEFIKMYKYQTKMDSRFSNTLEAAEDSLRRRNQQTAAVYLHHSDFDGPGELSPSDMNASNDVDESKDSLFAIDDVMIQIAKDGSHTEDDVNVNFLYSTFHNTSRVLHRALAMLNVMKGRFDIALQHFIFLGSIDTERSVEDIETAAMAQVANKMDALVEKTSFAFVLTFIEKHHLHQCLLDDDFIPDGASALLSLSRLVGLDLLGEFLMEHCVAPQQLYRTKVLRSRATSDKTEGERRGTLPLDLVAEQLKSSSKLLLWYLHLVFLRRPELYVRFPNTANPPESITELHRKALGLYIQHAESNRNSAVALQGIEAYRVTDAETPLLAFLKVRKRMPLIPF
jgi:vacuolar protein sorting-associated protein 41